MEQAYDEPTNIGKNEFTQIIESGTTELKCDAIVRAVHSISDYDWLMSEFSKLLDYSDDQIRGVVVTCIGHLARLNERSNRQQLLEILQPLLLDGQIGGRVEDAIDDINTFLPEDE